MTLLFLLAGDEMIFGTAGSRNDIFNVTNN